MLASVMLAAVVITVVPRTIAADPPVMLAATRGLVRDAVPTLAYDMSVLESYEARFRPMAPVRLGYAGYDRPNVDRPELQVAHAMAADIVFDIRDDRTAALNRR